MAEEANGTPRWLDLLWLVFLGGLALLPPIGELHKQLILLIIAVFQFVEPQFVRVSGKPGPSLAVAIKIALATILVNHTGDLAINSSYWPIYFLPVMTAAMYLGPVGTLVWTTLASAAHCALLIPVLKDFSLGPQGEGELGLRIVFFFMVGMIVNSFVMQYRLQTAKYQNAVEDLSESNQKLRKAELEARRAERLAALGQLSAGLAHEIRNPLGVIKGSAEILKQKLGDGQELQREMADYIYTEVNRLSALVSRFLDFARPSQLQLRPVDVHSVLEKSLKAVQDQGAAARVKIHKEFYKAVLKVRLDEELCEQVFTNLFANACEAMGETGGDLWIRLQPLRTRDTGDQVLIEVEDSGPGVPDEMREQIFNPFFTTKKNGVGLGLAIVSKIVDAHGGTIGVVQGSCGGACFRVVFPAAPAEAALP